MKKKPLVILLFLSAVGLGVGGMWFLGRGVESTDDAAVEAHAIPVSARISGYVVAVNVRDNQHVKKGDTLLEIDPRDYQLQVDAARAQLDSAEVAARNADINAERQLNVGRVAGTQKEIDNALAQQAIAKANVNNAKALLAIAEKNLADTKLVAPEDGVVTIRSVENGAYVAPGQRLLVLVGLERWVEANFKEVQITDMHPGQTVTITVDAYPALTLTGHVDSIQHGTGARFSAFPPENATGNFVKVVQRVPVKIVLDGALPEGVVLGPGFSVVPTVHTTDTAATAP